jgi:hypothetical protein
MSAKNKSGIKSHYNEQIIVFGSVELICIDTGEVYIVRREQEEVSSIGDPKRTLRLAQRQIGRLSDGGLEVLERYASEDGSESLVIDASPSWLETIKKD